MRFYKAEITTRDEDLNVNCAEDLGDLYEQLGRRAVVAPEASKTRYSSWGEERPAKKFPAFVYAMDARATSEDAEAIVREACAEWGLDEVTGVSASEVTFTDVICNSRFNWCGTSAASVMQKGDLFELYDFTRSKRVFKDWIVTRRGSRDACIEAVEHSAYAASLAREAGRIFSGRRGPSGAAASIPVHYLIEGCERADHADALNSLLESLLLSGRLPSAHVLHVNLDSTRQHRAAGVEGDEGMSRVINESLANAFDGNVLVLEYGKLDCDGSYDDVCYGDFCKLVEVMKPRLDTTLVVFSVPSGNADLKRRIRKLFGAPLVEIGPDAVADARSMSADEAMALLEARATERGLEVDGRLREMLEERMEDASFSDLDGLFDDWRRSKLVEQSFPEYGEEMRASLELRGMHEPGAMARLDELIGLDEVKQQIRDILARFRMNREAERRGLPVQPFSMHLAFLGAPGTGKTEVARLYGEILKEAGVLSEGRVVSVSGNDVDRSNVEELFDHARGSVLFVDEAYAMGIPSKIADFIACMENRREDTVVILAGYEPDIERLLASNPGFRSRLGFVMHFSEYTPDELLEIFELMCARAKLKLAPDARRAARDLLARNGRRADQGNARYVRKLFEDSLGAQQVRLAREGVRRGNSLTVAQLQALLACDIEKAAADDDFGNGRFARNLLESALLRQSSRLAALDGAPSEAELRELLPEDVEWDAPAPKRLVGFAA